MGSNICIAHDGAKERIGCAKETVVSRVESVDDYAVKTPVREGEAGQCKELEVLEINAGQVVKNLYDELVR